MARVQGLGFIAGLLFLLEAVEKVNIPGGACTGISPGEVGG